MSDDFCLMHGYDFMVGFPGEKVPHCELCDELAQLRRERDALKVVAELVLQTATVETPPELIRAATDALASIKENVK